MSDASEPGGPSAEALMGRVVDDFLERLRRGERPEVEEYVRCHPQLAAVLRQMLPALQAVQVSAATGSGADGAAEGVRPESPLGDYRIVGEIGRGGMGVVYEAVQLSLGRRVALKVLPFAAALDAKQLQRFKNEAQAAAQLHHSNIVPVYGVGCERGVHYYAMQLIEGQTLAGLIRDLRRLSGLGATDAAESVGGTGPPSPAAPPGPAAAAAAATTAPAAVALSTEGPPRDPAFFRAAARLAVQAAEALEYAHQVGVVHRDVKPANLLVDAGGHLWVTDFGLAHVQGDGQLTRTGDLVGTLRYMSPEQALGRRAAVDHRTDVYSLGATLYELLTLEPAFPGRDRAELLARIAFEEPPPPRRLNPAVPAELETIALKAMAKNPDERYATARELADDLRCHLEDRPIKARRPTPWQRLKKWARRHKPAVVTAAVSAVLLLLVSVAGLLAAVGVTARALRQEIEAKDELAGALRREQRVSYFQRVAAAHFELLAHNPGRGEELLDECLPGGSQPDLRGFEWYYLKRLRHGEPLAFAGHGDEVRGVAFGPDGRRAATGGFDGFVRVWDVRSGGELLALGAGSPVFGVASSADGRHLAAACMDGGVRLWDATDPGREPVLLRGHEGQAYAVAFSPDGRSLASGGADRAVRLWPLVPGERVRVLEGHANAVWGVAFSPDGKRLASAGFDETVKVWDADTGREALTLAGHTGSVNGVAFSPDGRLLASTSFDGTARLWDAGTGEGLRVLHGHTIPVYGVAFSPDGRRLATADKAVKLWDTDTGHEIVTLHGHRRFVSALAFSPDGRLLASAGRDGVARVWDGTPLGDRPGAELVTIRGHGRPVYAAAFSPDGRRLVSASWDGTAKVWDAALGHEVLTLRGHTRPVTGLACDPGGGRVATASWDGTVRVWEAATGRELHVLRGHTAGVEKVAFSPDGAWLASTSLDTTVRLWDAATGRPLKEFRGHTGMVVSVAFGPGGGLVYSGANDGTIRVWDPAAGGERPPFVGHRGPVFGLAFDPAGARLASASWDGTVRLWDVATREQLHAFRGEADTFTGVAFSPDGRHLAAANWDAVFVWEVEGRRAVRVLRAHRGVVFGVAFSPDGQRLASASGYGTAGEVKVWDAAALLAPAAGGAPGEPGARRGRDR